MEVSIMVAVKEFSCEEVSSPDFGARAAWREAVDEIAEKARVTLPACNGRVDSAVKIVLAGDVELLADGKARVASQANGTTQYVVCNGTCECQDFPKAPSGWCKHRIAAGIVKRAQALTMAKLDVTTSASQPTPAQPDAPTAPLPEAPVSITLKATLHGHEVMVTLRGVDFASVKAQVEQAPEWLRVQAPEQAPPQSPEHHERGERSWWCIKHGVQMKLNHKDGRCWWSHHTSAGWCKGK
jgi:hypothetical protein